MNTDQLRSLFPVTQDAVYLNNASQSPLNQLVYDRLQIGLKGELNQVGRAPYDRNSTKILLSKILGGLPEEYALVTSTGVGLGIVAQGIEFKAGDNVVIPEKEHWNNSFPWTALENKGVEIRFAKVDSEQRITLEAIAKLVDEQTRVVTIAAVRYNSGFRPNLKAIANIAHEKGALFVVDVAQAAGMIPINVEDYGIDMMAGCGFKWLLGMHGTGFLYVSQKVIDQIHPVLPGMFAAEQRHGELSYHRDARKFETGTIAYTLFDSWSAGLELVMEIGVDNIYQKAIENTDLLIAGILKKGYKLISPVKFIEERTAIIHFSTGEERTTKILYEKLIANKMLVTLQGENIRVSPNFFNTKIEIESFLEFI